MAHGITGDHGRRESGHITMVVWTRTYEVGGGGQTIDRNCREPYAHLCLVGM
jgi:hypothetical protein